MTLWKCSKWCILQEINHKFPCLTNSCLNSLGKGSCLKSPTHQFSIQPWISKWWRQCNPSKVNKQIPFWSQRSLCHPLSTSRRNSETLSGRDSRSCPRASWPVWWPIVGGCWPKSKSSPSSRSHLRTSKDILTSQHSSRRGNSLPGCSKQGRPQPAQKVRPLTVLWKSMICSFGLFRKTASKTTSMTPTPKISLKAWMRMTTRR